MKPHPLVGYYRSGGSPSSPDGTAIASAETRLPVTGKRLPEQLVDQMPEEQLRRWWCYITAMCNMPGADPESTEFKQEVARLRMMVESALRES